MRTVRSHLALGMAVALLTNVPQPALRAQEQPLAPPPAKPLLREQAVEPLPGRLDTVLMVNDNNPELISGEGILLSTFAPQGQVVGAAHLDVPLSGRFDLFSHHVYAGQPATADSTLWIAVVAQPRGNQPVRLTLLSGSTALSQSLDSTQPGAPFLPLPDLVPLGSFQLFSGPGSRVAFEILTRQKLSLLGQTWTLAPETLTPLMVLPLPVRGLDPLLNGRNLQVRLLSDGVVDLATLAAFGSGDQPPAPETWGRLLAGDLSPKEHQASPKGAPGKLVYSRVSGVQIGSTWTARITDPGKNWLSASRAPIAWPIASLERGSLGTGQVQSAALKAYYPGTAWAAHGNYGVEYDVTIPLRNTGKAATVLELALEAPLKGDQPLGGLRFNPTPTKAVMFRGVVEVTGLDGAAPTSASTGARPLIRPAGRQAFHLVLRNGQQGPTLGRITLGAGAARTVRVRLVYPADATPPQVLSLLRAPASPAAGAPVKQSPAQVPDAAP